MEILCIIAKYLTSVPIADRLALFERISVANLSLRTCLGLISLAFFPILAPAQEGIPSVTIVGHRPVEIPPPIDPASYSSSVASGGTVFIGRRASPPPDKNSDTTDKCISPTTDKPVVIATGEKFLPQQDFTDSALMPLSLSRTYRGQQNSATLFGDNWHSSLDYPKLEFSQGCTQYSMSQGCLPNWIKVHLPEGATYTFQIYNYATYLPQGVTDGNSSMGQIISTGNPLVLRKDGKEYRYDRWNRNILSISEGGQVSYTFNYSDSRLASITTRAGRRVSFAWTNIVNNNYAVTAVTAPDGQVWSYGYDNEVNLISVTPPGGAPGVRTYHYDHDATLMPLLSGYSVDGVRATRYAYDNSRRAIRSASENGERYDTFQYGPDYTIVSNQDGNETRYDFAASGPSKKLIKTSGTATSSCPLATASSNVYASNGFLDYSLDQKGIKTDYDYGSNGLLLSKTTAANTASALTETNTWNNWQLSQTLLTNAAAQTFLSKNYAYVIGGLADTWLQTETVRDVATNVQHLTSYSYAFHPNNSLASVSVNRALPGGASATSTTNFDANGFIVSSVNALGHVTAWSNHDGMGRPGRMTDANGVATDYQYDSRGNLTGATVHLSNGDHTTHYSYDGSNQLTDVAYADGSANRYVYNSAGRVTAIGNARYEMVNQLLDVPSRTVVTQSDRLTPYLSGSAPVAAAAGVFSGSVQTDSLGRPWIRSGANGTRISYTYDANGNLRTRTDAAGKVTAYEYDQANRLTKVTYPDATTVKSGFDANGNLQYVEDPRGLRTTYTYDAFGNRASQTSPDTGLTTFTFDSAGRLDSESRADGKLLRYGWDALARPTYRCGDVCQKYFYDEGANGIGRLSHFEDTTGRTTLSYDGGAHLVGQINDVYGKTFATGWTYDSAGRLTAMTYPSGLKLNYSYDTAGRLVSVTSNVGHP